jgi:hypothetical protein
VPERDAAIVCQRRRAEPDCEVSGSAGHRNQSYRFGSFGSMAIVATSAASNAA